MQTRIAIESIEGPNWITTWVYNCGWHLSSPGKGPSHPYRLNDRFDFDGIQQPVGILSFFRETGIKPTRP